MDGRVSERLAPSAQRLVLGMGRGSASQSWQWTPALGPSKAVASHLKNRGYFLAGVCERALQSVCRDPLKASKDEKTPQETKSPQSLHMGKLVSF